MRKIVVVICLLFSLTSFSQTLPSLGSPSGNTIQGLVSKGFFRLPRKAIPSLSNAPDSAGYLIYNTTNSGLYLYLGNNVWKRVDSAVQSLLGDSGVIIRNGKAISDLNFLERRSPIITPGAYATRGTDNFLYDKVPTAQDWYLGGNQITDGFYTTTFNANNQVGIDVTTGLLGYNLSAQSGSLMFNSRSGIRDSSGYMQFKDKDSTWKRFGSGNGTATDLSNYYTKPQSDARYVQLSDGSYVKTTVLNTPNVIFANPVTFNTANNTSTGTLTLNNQSPYTLFGRGSGTGVPSFFSNIDSNWIPGLHTKQYYDGIYQQLGSYVPQSRQVNTTAPLQGGGDLSADRTLSIPPATTAQSGYLTQTDWNTFNGKTDNYETRAWSNTLTFDRDNISNSYTQTGKITIALATTGNVVGKHVRMRIVGDANADSINFTSDFIPWQNKLVAFGKINDIDFFYRADGKVDYMVSIIGQNFPNLQYVQQTSFPTYAGYGIDGVYIYTDVATTFSLGTSAGAADILDNQFVKAGTTFVPLFVSFDVSTYIFRTGGNANTVFKYPNPKLDNN